jgi:hypothetical protein
MIRALLLFPALALPGTFRGQPEGVFSRHWKGTLIDADCPLIPAEMASVRRAGAADRLDSGLVYAPTLKAAESRHCSAGSLTRRFALALPDGRIVELDGTGQSIAARTVARQGVDATCAVL